MPDRISSVVSINVSGGGIPKAPVPIAHVTRAGLLDDRHNHAKHCTANQAISILDHEDLDDLRAEGYSVGPGSTGENLTVRFLEIDACEVGDRLLFSGGVQLELTKKRQPCYVLDSIDPSLKSAIPGRCGFLAKVIREGAMRPGETIEVIAVRQRMHEGPIALR